MCCRVLPLALVACSYTPVLPNATDGPPSDDGSDAPPTSGHLLITELAPQGGVNNAEFIELYNPTDATIALADYYVSDEQRYWSLPTGAVQILLADSDFLVKFPAGATIGAGAVIVIAMDGVDFMQTYSMTPDYTVAVPVTGALAMDMVVITPPGPGSELLSNDGEMLAVFQWDGQSDLVHDVDILVHGKDPTSSNVLMSKSPTDGPDADVTTTAYAADSMAIDDMTGDAASDESYKRIALEGAFETATGGNGITGHDETSELERMTWDTGSLGVTPGVIPAALR